ncbi:MAG: ATP-binding protein [Thermoguttaceae bacterium]
MDQTQPVRRTIAVNQPLGEAATPPLKNLRTTKITDYPHVSKAHLDAARKLSSPTLMGPPICDELIAFVQHLFTEEEAALIRHMKPLFGTTAASLANAERRPIDQIEPILYSLAFEKRAIVSYGPNNRRKYALAPILGGIFEMVLISHTVDTLSPWHQRFIELFETLYETGYVTEYADCMPPMVRYLPVGKVIETHPMALPTDSLEIILDQYDSFAVGNCQCRTAMAALGRGCGKPVGNCMTMGQWAEGGIEKGMMRRVSKKEALDIKREAEAHGMINWMMNVASAKGQCSCSCCGCCCHALRMINQFNVPSSIAPPHFLPRFDLEKCSYCGKCAKNCPMKAIVVDPREKTHCHLLERCVGCGLCLLACEARRAVVLEPVPQYKMPYRSWYSYLFYAAPKFLKNTRKIKNNRR